MAFSKVDRRNKIKRRVRRNIAGTAEMPRLTVYRSNKEIYGQLVDDVKGVTLLSLGSLKNETVKGKSKIEQAQAVGKLVAEKAKEAGIEAVVFDRNGYLYHGRVKAFAEAAREGGLKF